jgi:nucleotide-binding universal stress UspA family protein
LYKHILISTDGSELAQRGVDHGLSLAKALGSKVTIVTVTEAFSVQGTATVTGWVAGRNDIERYNADRAEFAKTILAPAKAGAEKMGVAADILHVSNDSAAEGIVESAEKHGCDLIVMSSHGRRGVQRLLLGSQTAEVLYASKIPVLVVR